MKSKDMIPTVLIIAGSDPSGGAGIQADLKTLTALGVYGGAVITCITVQNSHGVSRTHPLAPELVGEQIEAVLIDYHVTHVKIGMIGTGEIAAVIGESLKKFTGEVVYDPVMTATTGHGLATSDALAAIKKLLLPQVTVLTPNLPELTTITGRQTEKREHIFQATQALFTRYPPLQCVVVKGGHGRTTDGTMTDYCFLRHDRHQINHPVVHTRNTHGTGCTLATAFCAYHLKTRNYEQSFTRSVEYLQGLLVKSAPYKIIYNAGGHGPMLHGCKQ
jgi:hydroxymethylpyrimidine/phosphomethylpyrimidine kinase